MRRLRAMLVAGTMAWFGIVGLTGLSYYRPDCAPGFGTVSPAALRKEKANATRVTAEIRKHQLSQIVGKKVQNRDGETLGRVEDFVADMGSGEIKYVLISSGGFLGLGSHLKVAPATALSTATTIKGVLALNVSQARWRRAPDFRYRELAALGNPAREQQIYQYYGQRMPEMKPARDTGAVEAMGLELTSRVIGQGVVNPAGKEIGEVTDLLVDLEGHKPALAILSAEPLLDRDESFAVPLRSVRRAGRGRLALDANRKEFEQAPPFTEAEWQAAGRSEAGGVYRYAEGIKPDNTRRNALAWGTDNLTPFDQSGSETDLRMTRQIRAQVVEDEMLSLTAKNIKIITADGKVTLRGPVHTELEKREINRKAAQVAGTKNLKDELEIELK